MSKKSYLSNVQCVCVLSCTQTLNSAFEQPSNSQSMQSEFEGEHPASSCVRICVGPSDTDTIPSESSPGLYVCLNAEQKESLALAAQQQSFAMEIP